VDDRSDEEPDGALDVACRQVVELVTDYLEGALPPRARAAVERHLQECPHCVEYVEQMRTAASSLRGVPVESISPAARAELVAAFRTLLPPEGNRR
jgi:anti-sigma factor RsiW